MIGNYMKSKLAAAFLAALSLGAGTAVSAQEAGQDQYRLATELYGHGMFERAGSIFGEIYAGTGDNSSFIACYNTQGIKKRPVIIILKKYFFWKFKCDTV